MKRYCYLLFLGLILQISLFAQVGIGTDTPNASVQLDIQSTDKGILIPRMTSTQRVAIISPATGLMVYDTDFNQFFYYNGSAWVKAIGPQGPAGPSGGTGPFYPGKDTLGGIVYYVYTGSDGSQHGLIVSKTGTMAQWQTSLSLTNANRSWDGTYNTNLMTNSPAKNWVLGLGTEWYLPSIDELSLLWHHRFHVNKALSEGGYSLLLNTLYWSSTEDSAGSAWNFYFDNGYTFTNSKANSFNVRGVRAF